MKKVTVRRLQGSGVEIMTGNITKHININDEDLIQVIEIFEQLGIKVSFDVK